MPNPQPTSPPPRRALPADIDAAAPPTNIDRRNCHRVVPLEVLCLGLSRTGTASLRQALFDLGYHDVYHYTATFQENPKDCLMWHEAIEAKFFGRGKKFERKDWDQLLGHCMAITDAPATLFYAELLEAYPEAKVILTVRDSPEQWWNSLRQTILTMIQGTTNSRLETFAAWLIQVFGEKNENMAAIQTLVRDQGLVTPYADKDPAKNIQYYEWYNQEIQRIVPKEKLLVMNVKEGWAPLCKLLDRKVPSWEFPRVNDTSTINKNIEKWYLTALKGAVSNFVRSVGACVLVGGIGIAVWRWRS